jgi:cytochrome c5
MKKFLSLALVAVPCAIACAPRPTATGTGGRGGAGGVGGTGVGGTGGNPAGNLPCNIDAILKSKCQVCHGAVPAGAPFSLVTYADTQRVIGGQPLWRHMRSHVLEGEQPAMPPPSYPQLSQDEKNALSAWFNAGAPSSTEHCHGGTDAGSGGIGEQFLPCKPNQYFRANSGGGKYLVRTGTKDAYINFSFPNPFTNGEQAIAWAPSIDQARVIHHYILYSSTGQFVAGWAPGGPNAVLADDLGLVVDPAHYPGFRLQVHYNNPNGPDVSDGSGIAFCTTKTPRPHPMGVVTMGAFSLRIPPNQLTTVTGTCSNLAKAGKTLNIVSGSAHMHMTGYGFKTELFNAAGQSKAVITNIPDGTWSFDNQRPQPNLARTPVVNGDVFKVTCKYRWTPPPGNTRAAITFGEGTDDEMCFDFMSVYPIDDANRLCLF